MGGAIAYISAEAKVDAARVGAVKTAVTEVDDESTGT